MQDYEKLVRALRCNQGNGLCPYANCEYKSKNAPICMQTRLTNDAADAIEALQAEKKKTVTQIFGEEQMEWEGRCKDLMEYISDLQAEVERLKADVDAAYAH